MKNKVNSPVTLYRDDKVIQELEGRLKNLQVLGQDVVDKFKILELPGTETFPFGAIVNSSEALITNHLRGMLPDVMEAGSLRINREKVISLGLVELPGRVEFEAALADFKRSPDYSLMSYLTMQAFPWTVEISEECMNAFIAANSILADNDQKLEVFRAWQEVCDSLNSFDTLMDQYGFRVHRRGNFPQSFMGWFIVDKKEQLQVNHRFFEKIFRKTSSRVAPQPETIET